MSPDDRIQHAFKMDVCKPSHHMTHETYRPQDSEITQAASQRGTETSSRPRCQSDSLHEVSAADKQAETWCVVRPAVLLVLHMVGHIHTLAYR